MPESIWRRGHDSSQERLAGAAVSDWVHIFGSVMQKRLNSKV